MTEMEGVYDRIGEVDGGELKNVSKWIKRVTRDNISRLKIGKNGFTISFLDDMQTTAGKIYIPMLSSDNNESKEYGFASSRFCNIFDIFKYGEKARLWLKKDVLVIKEVTWRQDVLVIKEAGGLTWHHKLWEIDVAVRETILKKIPTAAVKIDLEDMMAVMKINNGKKVAEKYEFIAFCYAGKKVTVYAIGKESYQGTRKITKIKEVDAIEGKGKGIAIYRLANIEKILKGTKKGIVRIEEDVPLKVSMQVAKESKAVVFLVPVLDEDLRGRIAEEVLSNEFLKKEDPLTGPVSKSELKKVLKKKTTEGAHKKEIVEKEKEDVVTTRKTDPIIMREGTVNKITSSDYGRAVRLEHIFSFFRIVIDTDREKMRGYTTEQEALTKFEALIEVR